MRNATANKVIRMLALNFVIITLLPPYYFRGAYTTLIHTRCGSSWFDRQSLDVLFGVPPFRERLSLLKNPFALSSAPGSGAEYAVFVAFWPCFRALLDRRPGRHLLFQQADPFHALR